MCVGLSLWCYVHQYFNTLVSNKIVPRLELCTRSFHLTTVTISHRTSSWRILLREDPVGVRLIDQQIRW